MHNCAARDTTSRKDHNFCCGVYLLQQPPATIANLSMQYLNSKQGAGVWSAMLEDFCCYKLQGHASWSVYYNSFLCLSYILYPSTVGVLTSIIICWIYKKMDGEVSGMYENWCTSIQFLWNLSCLCFLSGVNHLQFHYHFYIIWVLWRCFRMFLNPLGWVSWHTSYCVASIDKWMEECLGYFRTCVSVYLFYNLPFLGFFFYEKHLFSYNHLGPIFLPWLAVSCDAIH